MVAIVNFCKAAIFIKQQAELSGQDQLATPTQGIR